ncbi:MAG: serpin family protein [Deltaproteobacteria bacterium]|nr:serpin family protein [Deltaproteobacteria bacterium]
MKVENEPEPEPEFPGTRVSSSEVRNESPDVSVDDFEQLTADNRRFAIDLYHQLRTAPGNLFYSPTSISYALAMTYAGARGRTAEEIAEVLHFDLPDATLHEAFNRLDLELASRGEEASGADGGAFRLNVVNQIFGQTNYSFLPAFLDTVARNYGSGLVTLDFAQDPEGSRQSINSWVERMTEERIEDLLPNGSISSSTRLVLANAIYFNAAWRVPFDEERTYQAPFRAPNETVDVAMMRVDSSFGYAEIEGAQVVSLPYKGDELDMIIVAPTGTDFATFEAGWTYSMLDQAMADLRHEALALELPKFEMTYERSLKEDFMAMGIRAAFGFADFSGLSENEGLAITDIFHKAFVKVNEQGTEAAAATAVVIGETSVPSFIPVRIDRPFLFFVRDLATDSVLFMGRVLNPSPSTEN